MPANHKLTALLAGRVVTHTQAGGPGVLEVGFDDGLEMTVQTGRAPLPGAVVGKRVRGARQSGDTLDIDFDDASSWAITTAGPTASVMVRDGKRVMVYAD